MSVTTNKNSIVGDKSAVNPGGIRLGTCALTTRGMNEEDMKIVADFLIDGVKISKQIQEKAGKKLVDFVKHLDESDEIKEVSKKVNAFAS